MILVQLNIIIFQHVTCLFYWNKLTELFFFFLVNSCSNCQSNAVRIQTNAVPNVPNKRPAEMIFSDFQNDSFVAQCGESSTIQKSLSEPVSYR